ncbi:glutenin, high molecular weight subunit DX5-like [Branchiostoma floridae]|uniref:Glutenin, high molecular weight subunit DX5-like n=1 Tax=Branchiostoma floridae TaxID=7739 RepID=A0A9J7KH10_BRAFL|nr:glutenin, high molecular weight subunit DX5-like [Branchiostoma floridae]
MSQVPAPQPGAPQPRLGVGARTAAQPQPGVQQGPAQPGGVQQAPAQPGGVQQAPAQPGGVQQAPAQPGGVQQAPAQPGGVQQGPAQPGGVQQAPAQPGGVQQGPAQPGGVQQAPAQPGGVQQGPAQPPLQGGLQPQAGPQAGFQGALAPAGPQDVADLRREVSEMRGLMSQLQQGRTVEDVRSELVYYAGRPQAAFDPHRAMGLMETLVQQARREAHPKANEFRIIVERASVHRDEWFFPGLILNQFGSGEEKKVGKDIDSFVNLQNKVRGGGGRGYVPTSSARGRSFGGRRQTPYYNPTPRRGRGRGRPGPQPDDACFNCGKQGHWVRGCPETPRK